MKVKLKTNLNVEIIDKEIVILPYKGREFILQIINGKNLIVSRNQLIEGYNVDMYVNKIKKGEKSYNIAKRCYLNVGKYYSYIVIENEFREVVDLYFKLKESEL